MNAMAVAVADTKLIRQAGVEYYYQHGLLHRTTGPAVYKPGETKAWYIQGVKHTTPKTYQQMADLSDQQMSDILARYEGF